MCDTKEYFSSAAAAADMVASSHEGDTRKNKCINKRRFSDEQVKSLESMFETESKLEPRMKLTLARELDLKPRQVAIWFQNRRARWKSKQLERDYNVLKANYDALASQFEFEKKEKQSLLSQLQKLHNLLGTPQEQMRRQGMIFDGNSTDGDSDNGDTKHECEHKPSLMKGPEQGFADDKDNSNLEYSIQGEVDLTNAMEPSANWGGFNCSDPFDQTCSSSQLWEFWS